MRLDHSQKLKKSLFVAAESLNRADSIWLLGGSCSLLLQGVSLNKEPRDLDVYADTYAIPALHRELDTWAKDTPRLDEEGMYVSVLSHYQIHDYSVELVGGFKITSHGSVYEVKIDDLLYNWAPRNTIQDVSFRLMPLSHELVFNVLREREDRYVAIAEVIRQQPERHSELLKEIVSQNEWSHSHLSLIQDLTGITL
ncbi:hypothetical protein [Paenibacillus sp. GCM10028914]|uniref:hypothetical protein n=1 Tax=Paenibacillus sp. GCM10028914 TaxID=3273416 RepID=UPI003615BEB8